MKVKVETQKKLYAACGGICAICKNPILKYDNEKSEAANSPTNVGRICHIKAESKGGPRYDEKQSEKERNGYNNLIILCSNCHTIIDDEQNISKYTVEYLTKIKKNHEKEIQKNKKNISEYEGLIEKILEISYHWDLKMNFLLTPCVYQNIIDDFRQLQDSLNRFIYPKKMKYRKLNKCFKRLEKEIKNYLSLFDSYCKNEDIKYDENGDRFLYDNSKISSTNFDKKRESWDIDSFKHVWNMTFALTQLAEKINKFCSNTFKYKFCIEDVPRENNLDYCIITPNKYIEKKFIKNIFLKTYNFFRHTPQNQC